MQLNFCFQRTYLKKKYYFKGKHCGSLLEIIPCTSLSLIAGGVIRSVLNRIGLKNLIFRSIGSSNTSNILEVFKKYIFFLKKMRINNLFSIYKNKTRLGRGNSSKGNTCSRGSKGQKSRSGYSSNHLFEGGQTPFFKTIPKFGFKRKIIKIKVLNILFFNYSRYVFISNFGNKNKCCLLNIYQLPFLYKRMFLYCFNISKKLKKVLEFNFNNVITNNKR